MIGSAIKPAFKGFFAFIMQRLIMKSRIALIIPLIKGEIIHERAIAPKIFLKVNLIIQNPEIFTYLRSIISTLESHALPK